MKLPPQLAAVRRQRDDAVTCLVPAGIDPLKWISNDRLLGYPDVGYVQGVQGNVTFLHCRSKGGANHHWCRCESAGGHATGYACCSGDPSTSCGFDAGGVCKCKADP